jgi:hypothetical protein
VLKKEATYQIDKYIKNLLQFGNQHLQFTTRVLSNILEVASTYGGEISGFRGGVCEHGFLIGCCAV